MKQNKPKIDKAWSLKEETQYNHNNLIFQEHMEIHKLITELKKVNDQIIANAKKNMANIAK